MDNLKLPAYPLPLIMSSEGDVEDASDWSGPNIGFTKLEKSALMIAQGILANKPINGSGSEIIKELAETCTIVAKAILEEANK